MAVRTPRFVVGAIAVLVVGAVVLIVLFGAPGPPSDAGAAVTTETEAGAVGPAERAPQAGTPTGHGTAVSETRTTDGPDGAVPPPTRRQRPTTGAPAGDATPPTSSATASPTPEPSPTPSPSPTPEPSFTFVIEDIDNCGLTCRSITATLTNDGPGAAAGVAVEVTLSTGSKRLWTGTERVGTLPPGENHTVTRDVRIGLDDLSALRGNDGVVRIETAIRHDGGVERFTETRDVL